MFDGKITLVTGPMFSGKSECIINTMNRLDPNEYLFIRNSIDTREYLSKSGAKLENCKNTITVEELPDVTWIKERYPNLKYVFIDEGQFFKNIFDVNDYADAGLKVVVAAIMFTSEFDWFDPLIDLYPTVDEFVRLKADCSDCGAKGEGVFTVYKGSDDKSTIHVGSDCYKTICRKCMKGVRKARVNSLPTF